MTPLAKKYCAAFPCNQVAVNGAYCQEHTPARAPKETDPFYLSVRWRRFRACYLGKHPLCEMCERDGRLTSAAMVDHIVELKDGGSLTTEENAMALCWKCHGIKTASEQSRRKTGESYRQQTGESYRQKNHQQSCEDNRLVSAEVS